MSHLSPLILTVTQRKKKKKGQNLVCEVVLLFPQGGWAKWWSAQLSPWWRRHPVQRQDPGGTVEDCLLPPPCPRASPSVTRPRLRHSQNCATLQQPPPASVSPEPQEGHKLCWQCLQCCKTSSSESWSWGMLWGPMLLVSYMLGF